MLSKILVHDDEDNNTHYVFGNFVSAEKTVCGERLNPISTTHISNDKIPVTCEECKRRSDQEKTTDEQILESLKALKYHETLFIDDETQVMRVPGGWMYTTVIVVKHCVEGKIKARSVSTLFVPWGLGLDL